MRSASFIKTSIRKIAASADSPKVHYPLFLSLNALPLHSAHWLVNCVSPAKHQWTLCRLKNEQGRAGVRREGGGCSAMPEQLGWNGTNWPSHKAGCVQLCRKSAMYKPSCQSPLCKGTVYPRRGEERPKECRLRLCSNIQEVHSVGSIRSPSNWCLGRIL